MKHEVREKPLILVVDDARDIVLGLSLRLRAAGFDVVTACNGAAGLKMVDETCPDAIVLDIRMPVMDGLTMLARLRDKGKAGAVPAVVLSANIAECARKKALELGARYFLEKPYDAAKVICAVRSAMKTDATASAAS